MPPETEVEASKSVQDYVCGAYFHNEFPEVLLLLKAKPAWQYLLFNFPGGKIEHGETAEQAVVREFHEETGVYVIHERWTLFAVLRGDGFKISFFRADRLLGDVLPVGTSVEPVKWFHVGILPKNIIPNLLWLVPAAGKRSSRYWPYSIEEKAKDC